MAPLMSAHERASRAMLYTITETLQAVWDHVRLMQADMLSTRLPRVVRVLHDYGAVFEKHLFVSRMGERPLEATRRAMQEAVFMHPFVPLSPPSWCEKGDAPQPSNNNPADGRFLPCFCFSSAGGAKALRGEEEDSVAVRLLVAMVCRRTGGDRTRGFLLLPETYELDIDAIYAMQREYRSLCRDAAFAIRISSSAEEAPPSEACCFSSLRPQSPCAFSSSLAGRTRGKIPLRYHRKARALIQHALLTSLGIHHRLPPSAWSPLLPLVEPRLRSLTRSIRRLARHNRAVHGDSYDALLASMMLI